jgi:hypothetical protein
VRGGRREVGESSWRCAIVEGSSLEDDDKDKGGGAGRERDLTEVCRKWTKVSNVEKSA